MILRITEARCPSPYILELAFNDGVRKTVNVRPLLYGPVFEPLLDPDFFARVSLDCRCGTVVWPNGADIAPEGLHELPEEGADQKMLRSVRGTIAKDEAEEMQKLIDEGRRVEGNANAKR